MVSVAIEIVALQMIAVTLPKLFRGYPGIKYRAYGEDIPNMTVKAR